MLRGVSSAIYAPPVAGTHCGEAVSTERTKHGRETRCRDLKTESAGHGIPNAFLPEFGFGRLAPCLSDAMQFGTINTAEENYACLRHLCPTLMRSVPSGTAVPFGCGCALQGRGLNRSHKA